MTEQTHNSSGMNPPRTAAARRPLILLMGIIIAVLGVGVSFYSVAHHVAVHQTGQTDFACNISQKFSCDEVALSKYSEIGGIPLGVFGLGYFVANLVLLGIGLAGGKTAKEHLHAYAAMVLIGLAVSLVYGGISVGVLGTYCLTCMGVYALTIVQAVILWIGRHDIPRDWEPKGVVSGGMTALIAVAAVIAAYNFLKPAQNANLAQKKGADGKPLPTLSEKAEDIPLAKSAYAGLGEDYRHGGDNAEVVIQEFADFQCPACQRVSGTLDQIHQEYGDKVLIVFRNYPLDNSCNGSVQQKMHEYACKAAVMARCAGQYGKFWQFYGVVYGNQPQLNNEKLKEWAKEIGLTDEQINSCWDNPDLMNKIKDDIALGNKLGVDSTPTLYINGKKVLGGRGIAELRGEIDRLLAK